MQSLHHLALPSCKLLAKQRGLRQGRPEYDDRVETQTTAIHGRQGAGRVNPQEITHEPIAVPRHAPRR
eukprot:4289389-Prymnesium_polylepis.1